MKRHISITVVICLLVLLLAGCQSAQTPSGGSADIGTWSIAVEGVDGKTEFTSQDAQALTAIDVEMTITNKNGESTTSTYTGVTLQSILTSLGVTDFTAITCEAADGFGAEYSKELATAGDTLLAWAIDGEAFSGEPPLRMCPKGGTGNQFVKNCAKIIVS